MKNDTTTKRTEKKMWPYSCVAYAIDQFNVYWSPSSQCDAIFRYRFEHFSFFLFFAYMHIQFYADWILRDAILISMHITCLPGRDREKKLSEIKWFPIDVHRGHARVEWWHFCNCKICFVPNAEYHRCVRCWETPSLVENGPKMTIKMNKQKQKREKITNNNNENEKEKRTTKRKWWNDE